MANCNAIVIIGVSSGGPTTIPRLIGELPLLDACVLVVQHMPKHINRSYANRLAGVTDMKVKLAEDGDTLENGLILVAPSEVHSVLVANRRLQLVKGEKVNYVCPSIDVAMKSVRNKPKRKCIGVVLTGMGSDGAAGMIHIKQAGGTTIAQDEDSSVIYGMPKAAVNTGMVDFILPPEKIAEQIGRLVKS